MEILKIHSVTYEELNLYVDLIYIYTQNEINYKEYRLEQRGVAGFVLYDKEGIWNGIEFTYKNKDFGVVFDFEKKIEIKKPTELIIDINELGFFGIESIETKVGDIKYAKKFLKKK